MVTAIGDSHGSWSAAPANAGKSPAGRRRPTRQFANSRTCGALKTSRIVSGAGPRPAAAAAAHKTNQLRIS